MIRRCVSEEEMIDILEHCHSFAHGGHYALTNIIAKVLQLGFNWPMFFKNAYTFVSAYDICQQIGNISRGHEMP